ncbi:hypothetical protein [Halosimplex halobium]|uniref:hypothetical protein n=1 Tax=Halosimplex halobium TaxID=3396618 RepID=UPI003F56685D
MVPSSSPAVGTAAVGVVALVVGALVRYRGWTFLVAGYDETSPIPEDVVAEMAGSTVLRVGVATVALGVVEAVTTPPDYLGTIFGLAVAVAVARLVYRLNTYAPGAANGA